VRDQSGNGLGVISEVERGPAINTRRISGPRRQQEECHTNDDLDTRVIFTMHLKDQPKRQRWNKSQLQAPQRKQGFKIADSECNSQTSQNRVSDVWSSLALRALYSQRSFMIRSNQEDGPTIARPKTRLLRRAMMQASKLSSRAERNSAPK